MIFKERTIQKRREYPLKTKNLVDVHILADKELLKALSEVKEVYKNDITYISRNRLYNLALWEFLKVIKQTALKDDQKGLNYITDLNKEFKVLENKGELI